MGLATARSGVVAKKFVDDFQRFLGGGAHEDAGRFVAKFRAAYERLAPVADHGTARRDGGQGFGEGGEFERSPGSMRLREPWRVDGA